MRSVWLVATLLAIGPVFAATMKPGAYPFRALGKVQDHRGKVAADYLGYGEDSLPAFGEELNRLLAKKS